MVLPCGGASHRIYWLALPRSPCLRQGRARRPFPFLSALCTPTFAYQLPVHVDFAALTREYFATRQVLPTPWRACLQAGAILWTCRARSAGAAQPLQFCQNCWAISRSFASVLLASCIRQSASIFCYVCARGAAPVEITMYKNRFEACRVLTFDMQFDTQALPLACLA